MLMHKRNVRIIRSLSREVAMTSFEDIYRSTSARLRDFNASSVRLSGYWITHRLYESESKTFENLGVLK